MLATRFQTLIDLCKAQPEKMAVVCTDGALTYGRLGARAQAIFDALAIAPAGPVLVQGHKECDIMPAMMAATFANRGFVFADISYPLARIEQIIATCGCSVAVQVDDAAPDTGVHTIKTSDLADAPLSDLALSQDDEETLFYVTFTSGSTGEPKGIPTMRASFSAFIDWFEPLNTNSAGGSDGHVNHASMAFDMSMSDNWTALFAGRTLYMLSHENTFHTRANVNHMCRVPDAPIGTLTATPAFYALMLEDPKFNTTTFPKLKAFWIGGEAVQRSLLLRLTDRFPGCQINHAYGPSEAACITHSQLLSDDDLHSDGPLPLGPEQSGCCVMVSTDAGLKRTGSGEILLIGPQVAKGYIPRSHPNNSKFTVIDGQRCYHTGDHGTVDKDGGLMVHGRIDSQVKVNGYRIELVEVERSAVQVDCVKMAVALTPAKQTGSGGLILVLNGDDITADKVETVRTHLRDSLPPFMVPSKIIVENDLPLSMAGKIDRHVMNERFGMV